MAEMAKLRGDKIAQRRRELGLSQAAVAAAVGISQARISQVEADTATPLHPPTVAKLAEVLGVPVAYLYEMPQSFAPNRGALLSQLMELRRSMDRLMALVEADFAFSESENRVDSEGVAADPLSSKAQMSGAQTRPSRYKRRDGPLKKSVPGKGIDTVTSQNFPSDNRLIDRMLDGGPLMGFMGHSDSHMLASTLVHA